MSNRYAKKINENLIYHSAKNPIILENGDFLLTTNKDVLLSYGYKEVICVSPTPEEGYYAVSYDWVETDTQYVQTWIYEPIPEIPYEPSVEERLDNVETAVSVNEETTNMLLDCILEMSEIVYA